MVVGAAGHEAEAPVGKSLGQSLGVLDHLSLIFLEFIGESFPESDGLGRDDVHEGATLDAGENGFVELLAELGVTAHDKAAPGSPESLVGGGGHYVGIGHRGGMETGRYETGDVGDVNHEVGPGLFGDLPKAREIDDPRISGGAGDNQLRLALQGGLFQSVVVDELASFGHP